MIDINTKYAGFWPRLLAHNIDLLPILLLFYLFSFIVPRTDFDYLMIGGIYFGYHILFEWMWQATPGKRWAKIKVKTVQNSRVHFFQCVLRNLAKIISLIIFFGGFVMIFFNRQKRGLHDIIGGTLVLFDED
ncbi:MAG: RDD family protein [Ekhidna sp.]|uniref:RDD family protein n=1 Tax=Ekhidna sp. TaxID=2608089 RepID=UPI00329761D5